MPYCEVTMFEVKEVLRSGSPESRRSASPRSSFIESSLRDGVRLSKVRRLLRRRGVRVPYPTLHRFAVEELAFSRRAASRIASSTAQCVPEREWRDIHVDAARCIAAGLVELGVVLGPSSRGTRSIG